MGKPAKFAPLGHLTLHRTVKLTDGPQEVLENKSLPQNDHPKNDPRTAQNTPKPSRREPARGFQIPAHLLATALFLTSCAHPVTLKSDRPTAPADGVTLFHLTAPVTIQSGARYAHQESPNTLRAAVIPGRIVVASGSQSLTLTTTPVDTDSAQDGTHDGTPDYLRLDTPADRSAFLQWFTYLAEAQFFRQPLPKEVNDCAALIRYCYREALSVHNDAWIAAARLPELPAIPQVAKYNYPFTPLNANLFRIRPGAYSPTDPTNGTFAHFADAETLIRFNAHFVSKDVDQAQPGDILMYRQMSHAMPFHTMIFLGASQLDHTPGPYVVYHTGPQGEIRRPSLAELQHHPDPQWRPFAANSNFLGIYRWNII
jgi:uncharacterized protein YfaT (DUF1175 family)